MAASTMSVAGSLTSSFVATKNLGSVNTVRGTKVTSFVNVAKTTAEHKPVVAKAGKAAAAFALAAAVGLSAPQIASADVAGLTPCKDSKAFAKLQKKEVKKLENRLKKYEAGSAPALALQATIDRTNARFDKYGKEGLLCGTDGLPHLIVDGDQAHLGEFVYPGLVFLYITGWIGWVGRDYLITVRGEKKPTEKEIIIDVPLALGIMTRGLTWPISAVSELRNGKLLEVDSKITVSPR